MSAEIILDLARAKGLRLATAESCTGGMIVAALTEIPGASDVIDRGFVTYSNAAKTQMLGVSPDLIDAEGAVSEGVASAMAEGALAHSAADIALSVTGIAGPGGSEHKPEGRVCFGLAARGSRTAVETVDFGPIGRKFVRAASMTHALLLLERHLSRTA